MPTTEVDCHLMLDKLLDLEEGLSKCDRKFIDRMDRKRSRHWTEQQCKRIEELWEKHCN